MRIIIAGAGDVGFHLARQLSQENQHITVIDLEESQLERVDAAAEVLTINGSATSFEILNKARVAETDLLLAVTSNEQVNLVTAIMARKLGAKQTLARISNGEYVGPTPGFDFRDIGIDHLIYPEELAAREIVNLIERAAATDIHEFENGKLTLIGLRLDGQARILHRTIQDVMQDFEGMDFRIVLISRGGRTRIPNRDDVLVPGDQIIVITKSEGLKQILRLAGKEKTRFHNIMILGGGKIGRACARMLQERYNIKLIESHPDKALDLADQLDRTLVLQGDGRDVDLLEEEAIQDMDAFISVTEDSETNIISSLLAREHGVQKTIAYVENAEYANFSHTVGINSLINKKLIAANYITRLVRKTNIVALTNIQGMDAEVLEFIVPENNKRITKGPLMDLKFPPGAIIGGIVRDEEVIIAVGKTRIKPRDRVVVFVLPGSIQAVEELFGQ